MSSVFIYGSLFSFPSPQLVPLVSVTLKHTSLRVKFGEFGQLRATVYPNSLSGYMENINIAPGKSPYPLKISPCPHLHRVRHSSDFFITRD